MGFKIVQYAVKLVRNVHTMPLEKYLLSKSGTSAIHVGEVNHLWAVVKTVQTIAILDIN